MDSLAASEREKYERVWAFPRYRNHSPGERHAEEALHALMVVPGETLIDYGCGCGRVVRMFREVGIPAAGVDHAANCLDEGLDVPFVRACLWDLPPDLGSDWAYCTDVMEHIPEEKVEAVLRGIAERTKKGAFFSIATRPDGFGPQMIGEPLHLTVRDAAWWAVRLKEHFPNVTMKAHGRAFATYACLR